MGISFAFAVLLSIMFRSFQSSVDVLIYPVSGAFVMTFLMAIFPFISFIYLFWINIISPDQDFDQEVDEEFSKIVNSYCPPVSEIIIKSKKRSPTKVVVNSIYGVFAAFFLPIGLISIINFMNHYLANPSSLSRWADWGSYFGLLILVIAELFAFSVISLFKFPFGLFPNLRIFFLIVFNIILLILVPIVASQSQNFSVSSIIVTNILLFFLCLLTFVFIFNFQMYWYEIARNRYHISLVSLGFFVGIILYVALNGLVTSSFLYNASSGNVRNLYWLGSLFITFFATIPIAFIKYQAYVFGNSLKISKDEINCPLLNRTIFYSIFMFLFSAFIATIIAYLITSRTGANVTFPDSPQTLKVMSFNIQNGFDNTGNRKYKELLNLMNRVNPDIIGLQETETNRITNGNDDLLRYLTDPLQVFSYYGPGPTRGFRGLSLMSRYPINRAESYFFSNTTGMQTGFIYSKIVVGSSQFTVLVTQFNGIDRDGWNNARELVSFTHNRIVNNETNIVTYEPKENDPILLLGDLKVSPSHEIYKFISNIYQDTYSVVNSTLNGFTYPLPRPNERRDFIFMVNNDTEISIKRSYPINETIFNHFPIFTTISLNSSCTVC